MHKVCFNQLSQMFPNYLPIQPAEFSNLVDRQIVASVSRKNQKDSQAGFAS
jgi:hypothetical protein